MSEHTKEVTPEQLLADAEAWTEQAEEALVLMIAYYRDGQGELARLINQERWNELAEKGYLVERGLTIEGKEALFTALRESA